MQEDCKQEWFEDWFNSPYYHLLYRDRNECEAEKFIDNLIAFLKPAPSSRFLDLACGKGRHSLYLNSKGFDVTGVDLSAESIAAASVNENDTLHFYVHDMRKLFRTNYYDVIINLFTSFGYFENERDDQATATSVCKGLKPGGIFVLDFMNAVRVKANLVKQETKNICGIDFRISKKIENGFIIKTIDFVDAGRAHSFTEKVKALELQDFERYFKNAGLKITAVKGSYDLEEYNAASDRLIIFSKREGHA